MSTTVEEILFTYKPNAVKIEIVEELTALRLKHYVYVLVVDNEIVVLGEGTGRRGYVIFPGFTLPGHMKAFTAALATLTGKVIERIIIPTYDKGEALGVESRIKHDFGFGEVSVDERNEALYIKRLHQTGIQHKPEFTIGIMPLMYATGSDASTFKKMLSSIEELTPGFCDFINQIFGGYYLPLYPKKRPFLHRLDDEFKPDEPHFSFWSK